jgi:hypothetical protein
VLGAPAKLEDVRPGQYDVLFNVGGHGPASQQKVSSGAAATEILEQLDAMAQPLGR